MGKTLGNAHTWATAISERLRGLKKDDEPLPSPMCHIGYTKDSVTREEQQAGSKGSSNALLQFIK